MKGIRPSGYQDVGIRGQEGKVEVKREKFKVKNIDARIATRSSLSVLRDPGGKCQKSASSA